MSIQEIQTATSQRKMPGTRESISHRWDTA